jgi:H+-translocating NAD(P) transhydrogenase subunit alpha
VILGVPKEILEKEGRVAAIPETVKKFVGMGFEVLVQSSAGQGVLRTDQEYRDAGAEIVESAETLFSRADVVLKVKQPTFNKLAGKHEVDMMREGTLLVTFLHPAAPANRDMLRHLQERGITAMTMDGIPRISRAQRMDALTSMSTVTGYKSVLIAANTFPRFIPLIGTAIGAIKAAKFLVVGVGVVGLQAIATAKRLGGLIKAVDINEEARKGADSLGAKVAGFDVPAELALGEDGCAKALPPEWLEKELEALAPLVAEADIVILGALVPGEVAPILITDAMVASMRPGSVIVDVAVDQGGNCEATEVGAECVKHRVTVLGLSNIPGSMPVDATWLYANNILHYVENLFKKGIDQPDMEDDIVRHTLVTHRGKLVYPGALKAIGHGGAPSCSTFC